MPGPDLSHREAAGVGVGMEHAHEVRDSRTALYRIGILGLGIWSIVAFVGGPGESPVSAEDATRQIVEICDDIDAAEAGSLLNMSFVEMSVISESVFMSRIDDGLDDLGRLKRIAETAAESDLSWSASAKTHVPLYEFLVKFFRTIRDGLRDGRTLSDLRDDVNALKDPDGEVRASQESIQEVRLGIAAIDECGEVTTLLLS